MQFDPVVAPVLTIGWVNRTDIEVPNEGALRLLDGGLTTQQAFEVLDWLKVWVIPALMEGETFLRNEGFEGEGTETAVAAFVGPENVVDISMRGTSWRGPSVTVEQIEDAELIDLVERIEEDE